MESDEELYRAWVGGDRSAGDQLIRRYFQPLGRFIATKFPDEVQDILSQTFEVCQKTLGKFEERSSFRTFLFGIANNVIRDQIKKKQRRPDLDFGVTRLVDLGPTPSMVLGDEKEQQLLLAALRALPYDMQVIVELSYFEGMTQHQIAEVQELPRGTVASKLRRAKKALDEKLAELAASKDLFESTQHGLRDWAQEIQAQLADADASDDDGD